MNATLYIRVSTIDEAIRGDQPEDFSVPALTKIQRFVLTIAQQMV